MAEPEKGLLYGAGDDDRPVAGLAAAGRAVPLDTDGRARLRSRREARAGNGPAVRGAGRP